MRWGGRGVTMFRRVFSKAAKADRRLAQEIELLHKSPLLDPVWYRQTYPDLRAAPIDVARHYLEHGAREGRNPGPLFDTKFYLAQNPDVAACGMNPLVHYIRFGAKEGRNSHRTITPLSSTNEFIRAKSTEKTIESPQVPSGRALKSEALYRPTHSPKSGGSKVSDPNNTKSRDLAFKAFSDNHARDINIIKASGFFDEDFYLEHNNYVGTSGANALRHYVYYGVREGRNPNPFFDTAWYLETNPTVQKSGMNPLVHYITVGEASGANPSPRFEASWYLQDNIDVAAAGVSPLDHFLRYGRKEGREPCRNYGEPPAVTDAEIFCLKSPTCADAEEVALFMTHSPHGMLKPHVRHYLASLNRQRVATILIVAADAPFTDIDPELLNAMTGIFIRRNEGYDFAAWAHILRLHPELFDTKILYLVNDSLVGPFNDDMFATLLTKVRGSSADLVGLTDSFEMRWHIQSYFLAFKGRALSTGALRQFVNSVVSYKNKTRVIKEYEIKLASSLKAAGLTCEPLFPSTKHLENRTVFHWKELITAGFPFVKVSVIGDTFPEVDTSSWRELLAAKGYDVSLAEDTVAESARSLLSELSTSNVDWPLLSSELPSDVLRGAIVPTLPNLKALHIDDLKARFAAFLASGKRFEFSHSAKPKISIVLVLFNNAHFTFACLESLHTRLNGVSLELEVIVFDNGSTDSTAELLERCANVVIRKSDNNLGFLRAVNAASETVRGEYMLLLNNDTELPADTLQNALTVISSESDIGAVGAKLVLPDGTLQEAGSIIWNDGTCLGYCRGRDPEHFEANFRRDVDYCSGAFLLTRTELFKQLGGFNPIFAPAYYEETDYCVRLWEAGWRVVYDPSVVVFHFEFASSETNAAVTELQTKNQAKFKALHSATLQQHFAASSGNVLRARHAGRRKLRLLFVDDYVPHKHIGAGFPRAGTIIDGFLAAGAQITLCPTLDHWQPWDEVRATLDPSIEVAFGVGHGSLADFIRDRRGYYDAVLVSRPHNIAPINKALESDPNLLGGCALIYDVEALFTDREIARRSLRGETVTEREREELISYEVQNARFADMIICVSANEAKQLAKWVDKDIQVLGHTIPLQPCPESFEERRDILFVGAIHGDNSPNADSVIWFIDEILPLLRRNIATPFKFSIAGLNKSPAVERRLGGDVIATGHLADLTPLYAMSRIFVAPTRFAAGIPHKVHEAAARGLPCVVTPLLQGQLEWNSGSEVLVGADAKAFAEACVRLYSDPALWTNVRRGALEAVKRECDPAKFAATLSKVHSRLIERIGIVMSSEQNRLQEPKAQRNAPSVSTHRLDCATKVPHTMQSSEGARLGEERDAFRPMYKRDFPAELDFAYYRGANNDLKHFTDEELLSHFEKYGRAEGRAGSALSFREEFLKNVNDAGDTLEIGPFCNPQLRGDNVRYFDIADRETLIQRAVALQCAIAEPPVIDYVSATGDMNIIDGRFDQVLSSHCVEHQPDLVRHLDDVSRILRDGGAYFLIVPDKRFSFDHYREESTIADVLGAHIERRKLHYARSVMNMRFLATHNDPVAHWQGQHGVPGLQQRGLDGVKEAVEQLIENAGIYIDTHAWYFTPTSFRTIVTILNELSLSKLKVEKIYNTPFGRLEFCAILRKGSI
jgi:GT2 family glycosyltransferase/SAM-dependent methyltransferase